MAQNYTLGRGEIYFARFADGTTTPGGERYIGNTPEFNLTIEEEKLEHFSSDEGIREKDDSVSLQVNRTGTLITDNIDPENVALFFFGEKSTVSEAGGAVNGEEIDDVQQGLYYQLGVSVSKPSGVRGLDISSDGEFVVQDAEDLSDPFTVDIDYTIDEETARLYIVPGGGITNGTDLVIDYNVLASSRDRVISGSQPVQGTLRYIAKNPKGTKQDYFFASVQISPNGDFALKSDEWQQIPFNIEILKLSDREAIYLDGRPVFA